MEKTEWQIRAEQDTEYNELMFLRWYYHHIQLYLNKIPFERDDYDTIQEWLIDYYEHPEWGSNYKLKAPESYRRLAANKSHTKDGRGYDWEYPKHWKRPAWETEITEDDK